MLLPIRLARGRTEEVQRQQGFMFVGGRDLVLDLADLLSPVGRSLLGGMLIRHYITFCFYIPPYDSLAPLLPRWNNVSVPLWMHEGSVHFNSDYFKHTALCSLCHIPALSLCWDFALTLIQHITTQKHMLNIGRAKTHKKRAKPKPERIFLLRSEEWKSMLCCATLPVISADSSHNIMNY